MVCSKRKEKTSNLKHIYLFHHLVREYFPYCMPFWSVNTNDLLFLWFIKFSFSNSIFSSHVFLFEQRVLVWSYIYERRRSICNTADWNIRTQERVNFSFFFCSCRTQENVGIERVNLTECWNPYSMWISVALSVKCNMLPFEIFKWSHVLKFCNP